MKILYLASFRFGIAIINCQIDIKEVINMVQKYSFLHIYFKMLYIELDEKRCKYFGTLDGVKFERNRITFKLKITKFTVVLG